MSTSGVPRPSPLGKIAKKAVPAAGGAPDDDAGSDSTPTDKAPVRGAGGKATPAGARSAAKAGGRTAGGRTAGARTAGAPTAGARTAGAKPAPGARPGGAKAAPAKATKASSRPAVETVDDEDADDLDLEVGFEDTEEDEESNEVDAEQGVTPTKQARTATRPAKSTPRAGNRGGGRPPARGGAGNKGRRPPAKPIKVNQARNWGLIGMFAAATVIALAIIGFGTYALVSRPDPTKWKERADKIAGIVDFRDTHPDWVAGRSHEHGVLTYPMSPPVGGNHNPVWQNCMGNVYTSEIAKEQAVHSLEHGAVWVTYNPSLPKDQVDKLAAKVSDQSFMLMSPYPTLDSPISLQAWGFQLKVSSADDPRIDDFINELRVNASMEPTAGCSGGITDATVKPLDLPGT